MLLVRDALFTAIDFESAGAARGQTDQPVQIGLASWSHAGGHGEAFVSYLQAKAPVQWSAQKIHGITTADLADAPTLLSLWPEVKSRLAGRVVVAHGQGTEKRFLRAFPGHGFGPWLDTLQLTRALWPTLPDHSLGALCDGFALTPAIRALVPGRGWHDALFDAVASLVLLGHAIERAGLADFATEILLCPDTSAWHKLRNA